MDDMDGTIIKCLDELTTGDLIIVNFSDGMSIFLCYSRRVVKYYKDTFVAPIIVVINNNKIVERQVLETWSFKVIRSSEKTVKDRVTSHTSQ